MRRVGTILALLTLTAASPAANGPPVPDVMRELFTIMSAAQRGTVGELRIKYQDQARNKPGDALLRVYIAWCDIPSDDSWNQLKGVASVNPDHPWVHLGMGVVYTTWKMRDQAKAEFELILKANPGFYPAVTGQADLALSAGDRDQAKALYQKSLGLGEDPRAHAGLGSVLFDEGKMPEAKVELEKAIKLWPDQPRALKPLVAMYRDGGDKQNAATLAVRLADLAPKDREARLAVADLRFELGEKEAAAQEYERLLRLGNPEKAVLERLAGLYRDVSNVEAEERVQQQLAAFDKHNPDPCMRLAELMTARGASEAAEGQLLEAVDRAPRRADAWLQIARLKLKRELLFEAAEAFRSAAAGEGDAVETAKAEGAALEKTFKLPAKKARGSVDAIYGSVAASLNDFFLERKRGKPKLGGELKLRVRVTAEGEVKGVDVLLDSVGDPLLTAHVYFSLRDAQFPKQKREPTFEFELKGAKAK